MRRIVFALIMTVLSFVFLNFIYWNLGDKAFGYPVVFKFEIPHLLAIQSIPIPMGFVLLITFCSGMVAIALLEAIPSFFRVLEIRSKNKKIKQLERELAAVRQLSDKSDDYCCDRDDKKEEIREEY